MKYKKCFKCHYSKPLCQFYKHHWMADGLLNKCKSCCKKQAKQNPNRYINDKNREQKLKRRKWKKEYQRKLRTKNPGKYQARTFINNAIRDNRLKRQLCSINGCRIIGEAHHIDYRKKLLVIWLCSTHHRQI